MREFEMYSVDSMINREKFDFSGIQWARNHADAVRKYYFLRFEECAHDDPECLVMVRQTLRSWRRLFFTKLPPEFPHGKKIWGAKYFKEVKR